MMSQAIKDLKDEIIGGAEIDDVIDEIAADYELNPALLRRKFAESGFTTEGVRAAASTMTMDKVIGDKVQKMIEHCCKRYGVGNPSNRGTTMLEGRKFTIICRFTNCRVRPYLAVCHEDARPYQIELR